VLRGAEARAALVERLADVDRLVLLGDLIELRHGPVRDALAAAAPVLRELGAALGERGEVVIVPGNHDHELIESWRARSSRRGAPPQLGLESAVDWRAGETLATVARWFAPAQVRAAYPGVWLRDDVYAMHGHYSDRHTTVPMLERLGAGAMARIVGEPPGGPARAEDYEATLAPIYAWIHAIAQAGGQNSTPPTRSSHGASAQAWGALSGPRSGGRRVRLRRRALSAGFPALVVALNRLKLGPLRADVSGDALRRAALLAFAEVVDRLGVDASYVVFGHTHRAGPLSAKHASQWIAPGGARLLNTGSWVDEPGFLGPDPGSSPYRAGFAVLLSDDGPPALSNLLD
jgi:predicted phosphodiesterase